jgi:hypothetical protein
MRCPSCKRTPLRPRPCAPVWAWLALVACSPLPAVGGTITFSDQPSGDGAMSPSTYTAAQGLPPGVTALFSGFSRSNSADVDHTPANSDNKLIYGTNTTAALITFNLPVQVPSLWVSTGPFGSTGDQVVGTLGGVQQFSFTNSGPANQWREITAGAGLSVDKLTFSNYQDSEVDDLTVVPEPGGAFVLLAVGSFATLRRRRSTSRSKPLR